MQMSATLLLALLAATPVSSDGLRAIPPGHEAEISALAAPIQLGAPVAEGYILANIGIEGRAFTFLLEGEGREQIQLRIALGEKARGQQVAVVPAESELSPEGRRAVELLRATVLPRVDAAFWQDVLAAPSVVPEIRSSAASIAPAFVVELAAFALILVLEIRRRKSFSSVLLVPLLAIAPLAVWYLSWGAANRPLGAGQIEVWLEQRERHLVQMALAGALAGLTTAAVATLRGGNRTRLSPALCFDAILILVWSVAVRFGLTTANVLTDGGSGWTRLLEFRRGFGGLE